MLKFRKVTKDDIPLMHIWFNEAHVQKFYSLRPWTEEEVLAKLLPNIEEKKPLFGYIALLDGTPVGYLQYCRVKDFPWPEQDLDDIENGVGLDIFIGEAHWIGRGLGPKIIDAFLKEFLMPTYHFVVVDPDVDNRASIKMFEKCGFSKHKIIATTDALDQATTLQLMTKQLS
jgi:RimJ/RimL family protein N-acetyltransferase